jgi:hypothetical protein
MIGERLEILIRRPKRSLELELSAFAIYAGLTLKY